MIIIENTLRPSISGTYDPRGGCYAIDSIAGHLDLAWTVEDILTANRENAGIQDYLRERIWIQIDPEIRLWLDKDMMEVELSPAPERLNVVRACIGGAITSGTFPLHVAEELGYTPGKHEWHGSYSWRAA